MNATVQVDLAVSDRFLLFSISRNIQTQNMITGMINSNGSHCIGVDAGTGGVATIRTGEVIVLPPCRNPQLLLLFRRRHPLAHLVRVEAHGVRDLELKPRVLVATAPGRSGVLGLLVRSSYLIFRSLNLNSVLSVLRVDMAYNPHLRRQVASLI